MVQVIRERAADAGLANVDVVQAGSSATSARVLRSTASSPATRCITTFRWLFEPILAAAGFEILSAEFRGSVCGTYTCRKLRPS
jgi:hypothetical protein